MKLDAPSNIPIIVVATVGAQEVLVRALLTPVSFPNMKSNFVTFPTFQVDRLNELPLLNFVVVVNVGAVGVAVCVPPKNMKDMLVTLVVVQEWISALKFVASSNIPIIVEPAAAGAHAVALRAELIDVSLANI